MIVAAAAPVFASSEGDSTVSLVVAIGIMAYGVLRHLATRARSRRPPVRLPTTRRLLEPIAQRPRADLRGHQIAQ